jgi:predicted GIY-YIG superfamily endonuclease
MAFWVYILECADGSYYVGHTDTLDYRLQEHHSGAVSTYTRTRRPVRLAYSQDFPTRDEAFAAERQIKGWTRRKKEALIRGDWEELRRLARGRHPSTGSG